MRDVWRWGCRHDSRPLDTLTAEDTWDRFRHCRQERPVFLSPDTIPLFVTTVRPSVVVLLAFLGRDRDATGGKVARPEGEEAAAARHEDPAYWEAFPLPGISMT